MMYFATILSLIIVSSIAALYTHNILSGKQRLFDWYDCQITGQNCESDN